MPEPLKRVYIPHSSDKTLTFETVKRYLVKFTSLIVQIKPIKFCYAFNISQSVYIPHSSDKTINNKYPLFHLTSVLYPISKFLAIKINCSEGIVGFCNKMVNSLEKLGGKEDRNFKIVISLAAKWIIMEYLFIDTFGLKFLNYNRVIILLLP